MPLQLKDDVLIVNAQPRLEHKIAFVRPLAMATLPRAQCPLEVPFSINCVRVSCRASGALSLDGRM